MKTAAGVMACLLILPALASAQAGAKTELAFSATAIPFSRAEGTALCRAAAEALRGDERALAALRLPSDAEVRQQIVFLSISDGNSTAKVALGIGSGLREAVRNAANKLRPLPARAETWLKLDIVLRAIPFSTPELKYLRIQNSSLLGIAFDWDAGLAFLPEELLAARLVYANGMIRWDQFPVYLKSRGSGDLPRLLAIAQQPPTPVAFFSTASCFYNGREAITLCRGHRTWDTLKRDELRAYAESAGRYLTGAVGAEGRFAYDYYLRTDRVSKDYNLVRHAGTLIAMIDLYALNQDKELLAATRRGLEYLSGQARPFGSPDEKMACFVMDDGAVNLGGPALALIAFAGHEKATGDRRFAPVMARLGNYVAASIQADGSFISQRDFKTGKVALWQSEYYPGEAIFGLARLHGCDPQRKWIDAAARGAKWVIQVRDKEGTVPKLIHDHWLLYALNALHRIEPQPEYLAHTRRIVGAICKAQRQSVKIPDWPGSYYAPPRAGPTATRTEGLLAAYALLRDYSSVVNEADRLRPVIQLSVAFQLQMQVFPETAMYAQNPRRALGGVRDHLTDFSVRIDTCQHHLSALLALYRLLENERREELAAPEAMAILQARREMIFHWLE